MTGMGMFFFLSNRSRQKKKEHTKRNEKKKSEEKEEELARVSGRQHVPKRKIRREKALSLSFFFLSDAPRERKKKQTLFH